MRVVNVVVVGVIVVVSLVSWCFEPSQPQRIASGLTTNFSLSPSDSGGGGTITQRGAYSAGASDDDRESMHAVAAVFVGVELVYVSQP